MKPQQQRLVSQPVDTETIDVTETLKEVTIVSSQTLDMPPNYTEEISETLADEQALLVTRAAEDIENIITTRVNEISEMEVTTEIKDLQIVAQEEASFLPTSVPQTEEEHLPESTSREVLNMEPDIEISMLEAETQYQRTENDESAQITETEISEELREEAQVMTEISKEPQLEVSSVTIPLDRLSEDGVDVDVVDVNVVFGSVDVKLPNEDQEHEELQQPKEPEPQAEPSHLAQLLTQLLTGTELNLTNLIKSCEDSVGEPFDPDADFKRRPRIPDDTEPDAQEPELEEQEEQKAKEKPEAMTETELETEVAVSEVKVVKRKFEDKPSEAKINTATPAKLLSLMKLWGEEADEEVEEEEPGKVEEDIHDKLESVEEERGKSEVASCDEAKELPITDAVPDKAEDVVEPDETDERLTDVVEASKAEKVPAQVVESEKQRRFSLKS